MKHESPVVALGFFAVLLSVSIWGLLSIRGCHIAGQEFIEVMIVDIYEEERWGARDGTTLVDSVEWGRKSLVGKLGSPGETIRVKRLTLRGY